MRRLAWVVAAVVVAGAGVGWVTFAGADSGGRYRVATAAIGDVSQTVSVSGTVDRVNRADAAFATSGVLASLSVAVGTVVSAGQELGSLSLDALQAAVDRAAADLSSAEANLSSASSAGAADSQVQEVKDAQSAASAALTAASDAVAAQAAACADPAAPACAAAGAATLKAQQAVQKAQDALQGKLTAAQSAQSPRSSAGSVADAQAAVDQAKVKLLEAQQALAGATLKSPITGTVASVSAAVGDQVSAGTAVVTVVGDGAAELTALVPVEHLKDLSAGQPATVTPIGTSSTIPGTVTRVGTLPDPTADTVAYPVTITVDKPPPSLPTGGSATASVQVAKASNVLTVPTSAVTRGTVTVLTGDQTSVTPVTVGAIGATRTEIKEGLSKGDKVVLANLDAPVPTADQSSTGPPGAFTNGGPIIRTRPAP